MQCRASALAEIGVLAAEHHRALAPDEALDVLYEPRLEPRPDEQSSGEQFAAAFGEALARGLSRDLAAGMTLQGPHRDDVSLKLNGAAAAGYASRAQQRTIALSLRLAEAEVLAGTGGAAGPPARTTCCRRWTRPAGLPSCRPWAMWSN